MHRNILWLFLFIISILIDSNALSERIQWYAKNECVKHIKHSQCQCFYSYIKCGLITLNFDSKLQQIRCETKNVDDYKKLPYLEMGKVASLTITNCPVPNMDAITDTLERLGVTEVKELKIQNGYAVIDSRLSVLNQHYADMPGFKKLEIYRFHDLLPDYYFENCTKLTELGFNGYGDISPHLLYPLENLKKIAIVVHNMKEVGSELFVKQKKLEILEINCELHEQNKNKSIVPPDTFAHQTELLQFWLYDCGDDLPADMLKNAKKLESIVIRTDMKSPPDGFLSNKQNLKTLNLAHNNIETLPNDLFIDCLKLRALYLAYNKIDHVNKNMFNHLRNLQVLNLENNPLTTIDPKGFAPVRSKIYVGEHYERIRDSEATTHSNGFVCKEEYVTGVCRFCNRTEYMDHFVGEEECNKATFT